MIFLRVFFCTSHKSEGLVVFYIFQSLIHIFKDDFAKFQDNSRTKGSFFKFQEFFRTKVRLKNFSRSVQTLFINLYRVLTLLNVRGLSEPYTILTLCNMMNFPIHVDTISMCLPSGCFKGS